MASFGTIGNMANRNRINPLSILFVLGLLCYGVYTGVNRSRNAVGIDVPVLTPRGSDTPTTVPVSSDRDGTTTARDPFPRNDDRTTPNPSNSPTVDPAKIETGRVVKIVDGDTLELRTADATLRIRLVGIDAPEAGQPFSRQARDYLGQLCFGQIAHIMVLGKDCYDRVLGDIYCGETWVNGEMVKAGMAWWYRQYSESPELEQLESLARQQSRGLWADARPTPPWEYRRR